MTPTSFKETNKVLGSGGNPNTDQLAVCNALHPDYAANVRFQISKWKLTEEEREIFKERGELWISIMGITQPPIEPMVINPFTESHFKPVPYEHTPGPTGQHPDGKISENDEGQLKIAVTIMNGNIVVDFGKPIHSLGFTAMDAMSFGMHLINLSKRMEE